MIENDGYGLSFELKTFIMDFLIAYRYGSVEETERDGDR